MRTNALRRPFVAAKLGGWRATLVFALEAVMISIALLLVVYSALTAPRSVPGRPPLRAFDAETVGRLEQRAWAAYYWRQWPQLFDLLLRLSRSQFGLSLPEAVYASYL